MILRPLAVPAHPPSGAEPEPIWLAIERSQQQDFSAGCWMVPQPAHAALSGDIAKALHPKVFPGITPEIAHGFALHDAGWSPDDAHAIQESRSRGARAKPMSFIVASARDAVAAWTGSIDIAGKGSPISGYLVSRHFSAIAQVHHARGDAKSAKLLGAFIQQEDARRAKLRKKLLQTDAQLDRLVEALQFCDLFSLYLSCGLAGPVTFPQKVGSQAISLSGDGEHLRLTPSPFAREVSFSLAAIRHPKTAEASSAVFATYIGQ